MRMIKDTVGSLESVRASRSTGMFGIFWRLLKQTRPLLKSMALAALLGLLTVGCGIGLMGLSAYLIARAAQHPALASLAVAIVGVRIFGIFRGIVRYMERLVSHNATFKLLSQLRVWFYQALEPLAPARLMQGALKKLGGTSSGDLLTRLVADIEVLQELYIRVIAPPVIAVVVALVLWLVLGAFDVVFALVLLAFFLLAGVAVPLLTHVLSRREGQRLVEARAALNVALVDSVQGVGDLLAFGQEREQTRKVRALNQRLVSVQARLALIGGLRDGLGIVLSSGCAWVMLLVAIPYVRGGQLNSIYLAFLVLIALSSFEVIEPLTTVAQQLGSSLEAARRLFEVVDAQPAVRDMEDVSPQPETYNLEVEHLAFRYEEQGPWVVDDVSFGVEQGECVAIVGPSGAGKSTLSNILLRFWEYPQGKIRLGGYELKSYRQEDIHRLISVVEQRTYLFNGTIRENLLIAKADASEEEIERAAQQAQLHDFIRSLPDGYDTLVGEQGFKLSGGERQRLAVARALLKDAPILILDEATANLDAITEHEMLDTLRELMRGRTTIMITHRLVGLEMANEILVMEGGKIRERGTQHDLLQAEGLYWKMWQLQRQVVTEQIFPGQ